MYLLGVAVNLRLAVSHGARKVWVFGSVALGDSGPHSDFDFLIELEPGRSLLDHAALLLDLQELLRCDVDVLTEQGTSQNPGES